MILRIFIAFGLTIFSHNIATAQDITEIDIKEGYANPSFRELYNTIFMIGGIDSDNSDAIDEYAKLNYCEDYQKFHKNDFEWNKYRTGIKEKIKGKKESFRVLYEFVEPFHIGRYDFKEEKFPIDSKFAMNNLGSIAIMNDRGFEPYCGESKPPEALPADISMMLSNPVSVTSINIRKNFIEGISKYFENQAGDDGDRVIYGRLRFRVTDALGYRHYNKRVTGYNIEGVVDGVDFFFDKDLIYKIPNVEGYN